MTVCADSRSVLSCAHSFLILAKGKKREKQNKGSIPLKPTLLDTSNERKQCTFSTGLGNFSLQQYKTAEAA